MTDPRLVISAGEASGDHHAARLVHALREQGLAPRISGMGGPRLAAAGMDILVDCRDMAIVGIIEVARHWRRLSANLERMRHHLRQSPPDLLILVDYPEFNLKLARTARALGIPVLYYISPQVWAWRPGRIRHIGSLVDMMAVLFPFERALYEQAGIPVRYVGHPLVDDVRPGMDPDRAREEFGVTAGQAVVALLPGSRSGEIRRLLPLLIETAAEIRRLRDDIELLLPIAPTLDPAPIRQRVEASGEPIRLVDGGRAYDVLQISDAAVAASGTITLEAALLRVPMAVVYRVNWLTYQILSRLITIDDLSLVNIVAERRVVEEFIQGRARPRAVAREALRLLDDSAYRRRVLQGLDDVRRRMGDGGAPARTADLVVEMLDKGGAAG